MWRWAALSSCFVVVALTPYGGWHKEAKEWTDRVAHTGDKVPHDAWDERFEHPARTWASASHRTFTLQATGVAMANATYMFMRENSRYEMMRAVGARLWRAWRWQYQRRW